MLVTNLRDFVLVGADGGGGPVKLEAFRLAEDADDFWRKVETPARETDSRHSAGSALSIPRSISPWRCRTTPSAKGRFRTCRPSSMLSSWAAAVKLADVMNKRSSSATTAFA